MRVSLQVPFLSGVRMAACSATHGIAATEDGRVYWWPHSVLDAKDNSSADSYEVGVAHTHTQLQHVTAYITRQSLHIKMAR